MRKIFGAVFFFLSILILLIQIKFMSGFATLTGLSLNPNYFSFVGIGLLFLSMILLIGGRTNLESKVGEIESIETERGSVYTYLNDGRTRRFKKKTGETMSPQDAIVFIPDWETIKRNSSHGYLGKKILSENEVQFHQDMLAYVHDPNKKAYIIDSKGKKLDTKERVESAKGQVFLVFVNENGSPDFYVPVSKNPQIGYYPFDTRKFKEGEEYYREKHIGNKIVKINLRK